MESLRESYKVKWGTVKPISFKVNIEMVNLTEESQKAIEQAMINNI